MKPFAEVLKTAACFVFFRSSSDELAALGKYHLAVGLFLVWLAGIGRHWDDEKAGLLQSLGVGSLIYVFVLAAYLWLMIWPLRPRDWSYIRVLTAVCLTAPPAFLYAIPIERWLEIETSQVANLWALGIVALWRVALFVFFLMRGAQLNWWRSLSGVLFPLNMVVCVLGFLHQVATSIADGMAGTRAPQSTPVQEFTNSVLAITFYLFLPLCCAYIWAIFSARREYTSAHERQRNAND